MATYIITSPDGKKYKVSGQGSREEALKHLQAQLKMPVAEPVTEPSVPIPEEMSLKDRAFSRIRAIRDVAKTLGTSMLAEPVAGLAGIAEGAVFDPRKENYLEYIARPFVSEDLVGGPIGKTPDYRSAVEGTREALTAQPSSPEGRAALRSLSETAAPVTDWIAETETKLGEKGYELAGPVGGAVGKSLLTAAGEAAGVGLGKGAITPLMKAKDAPTQRAIDKGLKEATPTGERLKAESTKHFKELDDLQVTVKPDDYEGLVERISDKLIKGGMDPRVTPEVSGALQAMQETLESGRPITLSEVEILREIANNAVDATNKNKMRLALMVVDEIDTFLENVKPGQLNMPPSMKPEMIGVKYKQARDQWGRFRRSEMLDKAVMKAQVQASGFENGLRIQFRSILNSEKKSKYFTESELAAMRQVEQGTKGANLFKALGKVGIDLGGRNNALLAVLAGGGAYLATGDVLGPLAVVGASSAAKKLAERLTAKNAAFANQVIRAGTNGREIVETYVRNTPKAKRNPEELSLLLLNSNIDLKKLNKNRLEIEATQLALEHRAEMAGALIAGQQQVGEGNQENNQ